MRVFKGFNQSGPECPVCNTKEDKECVLVGIAGTQEGRNIQAIPIHLDCLNPIYYPGESIIIQEV